MTSLDIIILILTICGGLYGYKNGLISQFFFPTTFIILIYKGYNIFIIYRNILYNYINDKIYLLTLSSITISIISTIFFVYILNKLIKHIITITCIKPIDKLGGMMLGIIKYFLYISIFLFFIKRINQVIKFTNDEFFQSYLEKKLEIFLYKKELQFKFLFDQINQILKFYFK
ncbi:CvpA family protein [Blattabacterium cuenoti]|uniref:CvpA family protein n=1 Tax=Blattabacterium cuenoti TaxID=1653831 RepID=UPI00163C45E1|nr:CvpA family protein [Blattabacterium cuenoti]